MFRRSAVAERPDDGAARTRPPIVTRRAAWPADESFVRDLFAESRDDLLIMSPDVRDMTLDRVYAASCASVQVRHPDAVHEILGVHGVDVGRLVVDAGPLDVAVVDLVVHRDARRRGIASAVLGDVLAEAGERPVRLSLGRHDGAPRALCRRLGFTETDDGARIALVHLPTG